MDGRGYGEGPLVDPTGTLNTARQLVANEPETGAPYMRVVRGGGYFGLPYYCKANKRSTELGTVPGIGFRLAKTIFPERAPSIP
jgi:hypothetical protein